MNAPEPTPEQYAAQKLQELCEYLTGFTKATSEALQELVVVLRQLNDNVMECGGKLDQLVERGGLEPPVAAVPPTREVP
jgi:hypothetical protein